MKRSMRILVPCLLAAAVLCGIFLYGKFHSPEYALLMTGRDIQTQGLEGLKPHLTEDGKAALASLSALSDNDLTAAALSLIGGRDVIDRLKTELSSVQWELRDMLKGKSQAHAILHFNYKDKVTGTLSVSMVQEADGWKISGIDPPDFETIQLTD